LARSREQPGRDSWIGGQWSEVISSTWACAREAEVSKAKRYLSVDLSVAPRKG
jgi:hypothetical protein